MKWEEEKLTNGPRDVIWCPLSLFFIALPPHCFPLIPPTYTDRAPLSTPQAIAHGSGWGCFVKHTSSSPIPLKTVMTVMMQPRRKNLSPTTSTRNHKQRCRQTQVRLTYLHTHDLFACQQPSPPEVQPQRRQKATSKLSHHWLHKSLHYQRENGGIKKSTLPAMSQHQQWACWTPWIFWTTSRCLCQLMSRSVISGLILHVSVLWINESTNCANAGPKLLGLKVCGQASLCAMVLLTT